MWINVKKIISGVLGLNELNKKNNFDNTLAYAIPDSVNCAKLKKTSI